MSSQIEIHSPLPVSEALARLRDIVGGDLPLLMLPTSHPARPLRGWVNGSDFAVRSKTPYGNSFAAVFRGTIAPTPTGSVLRANVGMACATMAVLTVWTIGVLVTGAQALAGRDGSGVLVAAGMLTFGLVLVTIGRGVARREAREVTGRLSTVLEATGRSPAA